jgi:WD40-like Beta Propeller Repeat
MGKTSSWLPRRGAKIPLLACLLGSVVLVASQSDFCFAAFPGANARIAYSLGDGSSDSIWSANSDGSSPTRLSAGSQGYDPAYSAAGSAIAFERGNDIYVMNADGSGARLVLAGGASSASTAKWQSSYKTPIGEIIPFVKITTVTSMSRYFKEPSFSPDGSRLAVVEGDENTVSTTVCAVGEKEGEECLADSDPDAYVDRWVECKCKSQIIEVKSDDGNSTQAIASAEGETQFQAPTFSAGGALAYVRTSPSTPGSAIFVIRSPGAPPTQITSGPDDYAPDFSPNGLRVVFSHGKSDLGLVGVSGGLLTILPIANPPGSDATLVESPVFSPDELRIAFERSVFKGGVEAEGGIYTIGADGSNLVKIVDRGSTPSWQSTPLVPSPRFEWAKAKSRKKKAKLDKKHRALIGKITCGTSRCRLKVISSRLKVGKKVCAVKAMMARKLAPGKSTKVRVKVVGKCLAAVEEGQAGSLLINVKVIGAPSVQQLQLEARLWSPKKS